MGRGTRHLVDIFRAYRRSPDWNPAKLLARMAELRRGAAYKRLGYLAEELLDGGSALIDACLQAKMAGAIKLDPSVATHGLLVKRWGLWVNVALRDSEESE